MPAELRLLVDNDVVEETPEAVAPRIPEGKPLMLQGPTPPETPVTECGHHSWDTYQMSQEAVIIMLEDQKLALAKRNKALEDEIEELRSRLQLARETCSPPPRRASSDIFNAF